MTHPMKVVKAKRIRSPEYRAWIALRVRCWNVSNPDFKYYGGRGIKVCARWQYSFANFLADMGKRPTTKHSLDRINNDGNYEPDNCRWATWTEQLRNRSDSKLSDKNAQEIRSRHKNSGVCQRDLAHEFGVTQSMISRVLSRSRRS